MHKSVLTPQKYLQVLSKVTVKIESKRACYTVVSRMTMLFEKVSQDYSNLY